MFNNPPIMFKTLAERQKFYPNAVSDINDVVIGQTYFLVTIRSYMDEVKVTGTSSDADGSNFLIYFDDGSDCYASDCGVEAYRSDVWHNTNMLFTTKEDGVVPWIIEINPLCAEAADEIERLENSIGEINK